MTTESASPDPLNPLSSPFGRQRPQHVAGSDEREKDDGRDAETLNIIRRQKTSRPTARVLIVDALLGIGLGILVVVAFSLMFKPLLWFAASLTGS